MIRSSELKLVMGAAAALLLAAPAGAQSEIELRSKARLFPEINAGVTAVKRDTAGRYYVLTARGSVVQVFDSAGKPLAQIPPAPPAPPAGNDRSKAGAAPAASLAYGDDMDISCSQASGPCLLYVADRGANAVRIFNSRGDLLGSVTVQTPTSVVALSEGEFAVASMRGPLVQVFNAQGKPAREFGALADIVEFRELNRFLNTGRLATDPGSHVYYAFAYVPEPTVRKYDRFGYAALEIELTSLDFQPAAQAARREIARQEERTARSPAINRVINAIGVDAEAQEVWIAVGNRLLQFDTEGGRRGTYRIFTAEGQRVEPSAILVEAERLIIATETLGVFEFPRPDKKRQ